ncbi:MAG: hypothetical protein KDK27_16120, partial [Leptospiraceae bacterium]|nr:hypothetical protein [Leptospiraceae bacterium]
MPHPETTAQSIHSIKFPVKSDVQFIIHPDRTPASELYGDVYFSRENGLAESEYVFLKHNRLPQRWQTHIRPLFQICELGFGTGL